jgi:ATPase subunit of ABC transporter with duplicated ATPase domains
LFTWTHPQAPQLEKENFADRESPPFSPGNTMIEISHLSKRYGELTAVDDISFNVQPGEVLGFLGPNRATEKCRCAVFSISLPTSAG